MIVRCRTRLLERDKGRCLPHVSRLIPLNVWLTLLPPGVPTLSVYLVVMSLAKSRRFILRTITHVPPCSNCWSTGPLVYKIALELPPRNL